MLKYCIVIPAYNSAATIAVAVQSALAQEHERFGVVVSDNASSDGSIEYLRSVRDPRLKVVINQERLGKTDNWNRAFQNATPSEFFMILHSDDVLLPSALATVDATVRNQPGGALYFFNHDRLSVDGRTVAVRNIWPRAYRLNGKRFRRMQVLSNAVSVVGTVFPSKLYFAIGGFDRRFDYYQDMEFYHRLSEYGNAVYFPAKLGFYRDAPLRPANRYAFACEELRWLKQNIGCWPRWLGWYVLRCWAQDALVRMRGEVPEIVADYEAELARHGLGVLKSRNLLRWGSHTRLHRIYKLYCTLAGSL